MISMVKYSKGHNSIINTGRVTLFVYVHCLIMLISVSSFVKISQRLCY